MTREPARTGETEGGKAYRNLLERIERLQEERKAIGDDIADLFKELESSGYDKAATKIVLKIRAADDGMAQYTDRTGTVDTYLAALGMLPDRAPAPAPARTHGNITEFPLKSEPKSSAPTSSPAVTKEPEASPLPSSGSANFKLRPHCLRPELCAGSGREHCHACKQAMSATLQHEAVA